MLCFVSHLVWCPVKVHSYCVSGYSAKKIKIQLSLGSLFKDFCSERWFSIVKVLLLSYLPLPIGQLLIAVIALQGAEFLLESSLEGQMWMKTSNVKRNVRWWVQCWRKPGKSRGGRFLAGSCIFWVADPLGSFPHTLGIRRAGQQTKAGLAEILVLFRCYFVIQWWEWSSLLAVCVQCVWYSLCSSHSAWWKSRSLKYKQIGFLLFVFCLLLMWPGLSPGSISKEAETEKSL